MQLRDNMEHMVLTKGTKYSSAQVHAFPHKTGRVVYSSMHHHCALSYSKALYNTILVLHVSGNIFYQSQPHKVGSSNIWSNLVQFHTTKTVLICL